MDTNAFDYFVGGELAPWMTGQSSAFAFDYFVGGEIWPGMTAPAEVGGVSIPILSYHYNHHLGSMA